jgi:hypothetical protein
VEKVYDICGLYLNPPERAVVVCVDEKSQIQALDRTRPILPMLPGTPRRATDDDKRHGTLSLYAALDLTTGKVIGKLHQRHRAIEFHTFLQTIDREVPAHLDAPLALDSSCTHKTPEIQRWLAAHPVAHQSVRALNADIRAWIENWSEDPRPYVWTKPAQRIRDSIARYCQRINQTGH